MTIRAAVSPSSARSHRQLASLLARKRLFDVIFCLVIFLPVALVAVTFALAIRLDSAGPVMFTQVRTGKDGRLFRVYKFRTMVRKSLLSSCVEIALPSSA